MLDKDFITGTMRQGYNTEPNSLGFIPDTKIASYYIPRGFYLIQSDRRGRSVGYILHGKPQLGGVLTIAQAIIDVDHRLVGHGEGVVSRLVERASAAQCSSIKLRCAVDLPANEFWVSCGFELIHTAHPRNKRQRAINIYLMQLWKSLWDLERGDDT